MPLEDGAERCSCVRKNCERHGDCKACLAHHQKQGRFPPYCKRAKRAKKSKKPGNGEKSGSKMTGLTHAGKQDRNRSREPTT